MSDRRNTYIKRTFWMNRGLYISNAVTIAVAYIFGMLFHDIVLAISAAVNDDEMTTCTVGTIMALIGMVVWLMFFSSMQSVTVFNRSVSMGMTRREYFAESLLHRLVLIMLDIPVVLLLHMCELLKIKLMYPQLELEGISAMPGDAYVYNLAIVGFVGVGMLLMALCLKMGMRANLMLAVIYMVMALGSTLVGRIIDSLPASQMDTTMILHLICVMIAVFSVASVAASHVLIKRQMVMG